MGSNSQSPHTALGSALRAIRLRKKESLLEASSAIEISGERLARIENGELHPTEDILLLLVSHYLVSEKEEEKLWELAGYGKRQYSEQDKLDSSAQQNFFVMPFDARVVYADSVQIVINDHGVIMNFLQPSGPGQQLAIARVGMSREHAKSVLQVLQKTLSDSENTSSPEQKRLRASNNDAE